jgi:hypothetical protein
MSEVDVELMKKFRDFIMHVVKRDSITAFGAFDENLTGCLDISESKKSALEYDFKGEGERFHSKVLAAISVRVVYDPFKTVLKMIKDMVVKLMEAANEEAGSCPSSCPEVCALCSLALFRGLCPPVYVQLGYVHCILIDARLTALSARLCLGRWEGRLFVRVFPGC